MIAITPNAECDCPREPILVTSEVIAACIVGIPESALDGLISKNCEPEGNLPE
jgi:hypothetical protein